MESLSASSKMQSYMSSARGHLVDTVLAGWSWFLICRDIIGMMLAALASALP